MKVAKEFEGLWNAFKETGGKDAFLAAVEQAYELGWLTCNEINTQLLEEMASNDILR